jgi:hypothetical protein
MDPYLERPDVFPDLHSSLIIFLKNALQRKLPEPYFASSDRRTWVEHGRYHYEPDVDVVFPTIKSLEEVAGMSVSVGTLERTAAEPLIVRVSLDPREQLFLNVYTGRGDERRVVTSIEFLSPSNKGSSGQGRRLYLLKQKELLTSQVHLVEVDLLRGGTHTTAVPRPLLLERAPWLDYHVCIRRFDQLEELICYPFRLEDPLPSIPIPLLPGDGSVEIDLQSVFNAAYDAGPYSREIDYAGDDIVPPLPPDQAEWIEQILERSGR